ncbi:unnamed protein product [Owenia fusiformis]|uniref:Uncharacterized protein n=1 Tax=Owenia fusiformis TaxID=6347 RepID=A0A8S4P100_OWEFU|nr:unnamed protein product [Owenia fusiformis]
MTRRIIHLGLFLGILILILSIHYTRIDSEDKLTWQTNWRVGPLGAFNRPENHSNKTETYENMVGQNHTEKHNEMEREEGQNAEIKKYDIIQKDRIENNESYKGLTNIFPENKNNSTSKALVPNLVHYVWLDMKGKLNFEFLHTVSMISVHKRWKPDKIFLHVYQKNYPHGKWWDYVKNNVSGIKIVEHEFDELTIYGEVPKYVEHMADFLRIKILREYGGIYIDTDVIALRSLEPLRHYDHTQGVGLVGTALSNGVIIAKKTSILLELWLEAYRTYNKIDIGKETSFWQYYSINVPRTLADIYPRLIHIEKDTLVRPKIKSYSLEPTKKYVWENNYSVHVWHRALPVPKSPGEIKDLQDEYLLKEVIEYIWYDKPPPIR